MTSIATEASIAGDSRPEREAPARRMHTEGQEMETSKLVRRYLGRRHEAGAGTAEYIGATAFLLLLILAWLSAYGEKMRSIYGNSANSLAGGAGLARGGRGPEDMAGDTQCPGGVCACFVAGTLVDAAEGSKPIEAVRLGDRVGPESAECADLRTDGWREVDLRMPVPGKPAGGEDLQISLLRPTEWFAEKPASPGGKIFLHLEELKIQGEALVTDVRWASPLKPGARCPVTGLMRHISPDVIAVALKGGSVLEVTKHHPLYSADRNAWVEAGELAAGEDLATRGEVARVEAVFDVPRGPTEVFNLEVMGEHRYFVGEMRVLAHNACTGAAGQGAGPSRWMGPSGNGASSGGPVVGRFGGPSLPGPAGPSLLDALDSPPPATNPPAASGEPSSPRDSAGPSAGALDSRVPATNQTVVQRTGAPSSLPNPAGPSLLDALDSRPPATDQASTSNPDASAPASSITPRSDLSPKQLAELMERENYYATVIDALEQTIAERPAGPERRASEAALDGVKSKYDEFVTLLEGPPPGEGRVGFMDAERDAIEMMRTTERMRQEVAKLCLSNPEAISKLDNFDQRQTATENMVAIMVQEQLDSIKKLPLEALPGREGFIDSLKSSSGDMKNDIKLAQTEAAIQGQVTETLGQALIGAGQAEIDGSIGAGHKIGQVIGPRISEVLRIDTRRPNERVSDQINRTYEPFFHARPDGNTNFDLAPNPNAKGRISNDEFVASLEVGVRRQGQRNGFVVGTGTEMAVEASPHVELVGPLPGEPESTLHVILSPEARARIDALRNRTGASSDRAPIDRFTDVGMRAAEERRLNELKISLQQTFGPEVTRMRSRAESIFNLRPQLADQKATVLEVTMEELMRCKTREEMLETIAATRASHDELIQNQMIPARGGRTAAALDEMEQSIVRFFGS
jgi:cbb3-type cytochrome oxidase subunit 3